MGKVNQLAREFRPDAEMYNTTAQLVAAEYLTSLSIYGGGTERLQYRMGFHDREGKLVTVVIMFSLSGNVTRSTLAAHYETNLRSQVVAREIMKMVPPVPESLSIGEHIVFWQHKLHELFSSRVVWELWQFHLSSLEETGWILASPQ
jgi:hypothetical protein